MVEKDKRKTAFSRMARLGWMDEGLTLNGPLLILVSRNVVARAALHAAAFGVWRK